MAHSPGISLMPAIRDEETLSEQRPIFSRNSAFGALSDGVVYRGRKYIEFFDVATGKPTRRRIFDLESDPHEVRSLGEEFGEAEAAMREAAGDHGLAFESHFHGVTPELEAQLKALGYLRDD